jgi:pilus assembly protein CpaB
MAVFMIYNYITSKEEEIKAKYGTEQAVVIAKRNIGYMAEIKADMLEIVAKPKRFVEPGRTSSTKEVEGFIAAVPINKGEQITLNKIIEPGIQTGLSRQVSMGKRAIAVPVDDNTAVNRLLKPGDRVDMIATIDPPGGAKGSQLTKIVAQDIVVLAVGEFVTTQAPRKTEKDDTTGATFTRKLNLERNFNTITIEVDPQIATQVTLLRDSGMKVGLMLRNNDDTERVNIPAMTLLDVLGPDQSKIIRAPAQK